MEADDLRTELRHEIAHFFVEGAGGAVVVALGAVATADKALNLFAGVVVVAVAGELLRRVRLERRSPAERMAPRWSDAWQRLHGREPMLPRPAVKARAGR